MLVRAMLGDPFGMRPQIGELEPPLAQGPLRAPLAFTAAEEPPAPRAATASNADAQIEPVASLIDGADLARRRVGVGEENSPAELLGGQLARPRDQEAGCVWRRPVDAGAAREADRQIAMLRAAQVGAFRRRATGEGRDAEKLAARASSGRSRPASPSASSGAIRSAG
jgi:hypothetical protein